MESNELIAIVAEAVEVPTSSLTLQTELDSLPEWNSISMLSIIGKVDTNYGVTLNSADIQDCKTVGELIDSIVALKK